MPEFNPMDYEDVEKLWHEQRPLRKGGVTDQLRGMEIGVPRVIRTRTNWSTDKGKNAVRYAVRRGMAKLGYENADQAMVVFHEGQVIVCRPLGAVPRRGPTLREIDSREVAS